jgi:hypothetical protein
MRAGMVEALRTAVKRLAYPERDGLAYLRQRGSYPSLDELALALDDELGRVRTQLPLDHPLLRLGKQLSEMSGRENVALRDADALDAEPWMAVRRIAIEALAELDQHPCRSRRVAEGRRHSGRDF